MVEEKCGSCGSTVGLIWLIIPIPDGDRLMAICPKHDYPYYFTQEYPREASTFDTLEEAQVALVKRSL
jgi:hypothetical protein